MYSIQFIFDQVKLIVTQANNHHGRFIHCAQYIQYHIMKSFVTFGLATIIACSSLTVGNAFVINNNKRVVSIQALSSLQMTLLRYGEKKKDFPAGSPLKNACASLGVKPKYSCKL
jgi:hypothetical protein